MRRIVLHIAIILFALPLLVKSQEAIQFSQIHKVLEYVNPAYNFSKNNPGGSIVYRNQWAGVIGAPKTYAINLHYPFQFQNIGIGGSVIKEQIGLRNTIRTGISTDIGIRSTEKSFLSMGLHGGVKHSYYTMEDAVAVNYEDVITNESIVSPYLSSGLMYFTRRFQAGASMFVIIPGDEDFNFRKNISLNIHTSYYFRLNQFFALKPVLLYKQNTLKVAALDIGSFLLYKDVLWFGVSYRMSEAMIASIDIKLTDKLRFGYSYDISLQKSKRMIGNTSEIRLEFELNHFKKNEYLKMRREITN